VHVWCTVLDFKGEWMLLVLWAVDIWLIEVCWYVLDAGGLVIVTD